MLDSVKLPPSEIAAALVAVSFAAGLNGYATVATLGLLARAGLLRLPPALDALTSWWAIGASAALFLVEFFADKVPAFDLVWNALHTFIRVPVAALLAYRATSELSPEKQLLATLLGASIPMMEERSLARRPSYQNVIDRVSKFVPRPPRKVLS